MAVCLAAGAQTGAVADSLKISLLTCGAGEEVYNLFGHSAIRIQDTKKGTDYVYNYGIFSFDTPNFALRFTLGQTDYELGVQYYQDFIFNYRYHHREVYEQDLNLSPEEKKKLAALLNENYLLQNRVYRYNYFYDNCATRPRDMIEKAINGSIEYAEDMETPVKGTSYRSLLHQYTRYSPWSRFGIDLCLGSEADRPINRRAAMFIPFHLQEDFATAQIIDTRGVARPLVTASEKIVQINQNFSESADTIFTPLRIFLLLFIVIGSITIRDIRHKKSMWGVDVILFLSAGVAGCILAFLALFSQHPAVSPNYLLIVFHPLHLLCLPWVANKVRNREKSLYLTVNTAIFILFLILWPVFPQKFPTEVLLLVIILLIRSLSHLLISHQKA